MSESYDEARKKLNYPPSRLDASDLSSTDEVVQRLRKRPLNEPESSSSEDDSHGLFKSPPSEKRKKMPTKSQAIFSPPPPPPVPAMKDFSGSVPTPTLMAVETLNSNPTIVRAAPIQLYTALMLLLLLKLLLLNKCLCYNRVRIQE